MKFKKLTIKNFGSIKCLEFSLENQGLTLITGRNEDAPRADSNGSGKSLLLDAFTWCVWGKSVRGIKHDSVVNEQIGKDCCVSLDFEDSGNNYTVTRYRKNKSNKDIKSNDLLLFVNGQDDSGVSIDSTQIRITEIIGLDFITFCAIMVGAGVQVASLGDAEIKALLERLLQTEILGKARDRVKEQFKTVEADLSLIRYKYESAVRIKHSELANLRNLEQKRDTFEDGQNESVRMLQVEYDKEQDRLKSLDNIIKQGSNVVDRVTSVKNKIQSLETQLAQVKFVQTNKTMDLLIQQKISLQTKLELLESQVKKLESLESKCFTCYQNISIDHVKEIRKDVLIQKSVLLQNIEFNKSKIEQEQQAIETRNALSQEQRGKLSAELSLVKRDLTTLQELEFKVKAAKNEVKSVADNMKRWTSQIAEVKKEQNPFEDLVEKCRTKIKESDDSANGFQKEICGLESQYELLKYWITGFSPSGVRSHMLEHITPMLNSAAKKYSDILTNGEMSITFHTKDVLKTGTTREKFNISVKQSHGGSSYEANSTGERARANLVIALALGDLAALRVNKSIPFRFLDEPFESIDESGTEAIMQLLKQQREQHDTVFVITHQDHFKQLFDKKLTIVKKGGFSDWEK